MRFLHVSDLHIGKRVNGMSLAEDHRFILDAIVSLAESERADAVVIAGDIYDKAAPSAEAVSLFDAFLTKLSQAQIKVLAIPGNHDSAERIAYAQELLAEQGVCFAPVFDGKLAPVKLEDEHGPVMFWLVPYLKPADVRRFFPDEEIGEDYSAALEALLSMCDVDESQRNVIVSHQLVTAFGTTPDRADDEIKLGGIDNVDFSVYDRFDYVALGHVHRPQRVGRDTVRYSGSPLKYSFSEAPYDKSAVIVDLGPKGKGEKVASCVRWRLAPLVGLHDMREVKMTLAELLESGAAGGDDVLDYLHVTLTDELPQLDAMAKIHDVFPNAMTLDYESPAMLVNRRDRQPEIDPDEMDAFELFERFFEWQLGKELDDVQRDLVRAAVHEAEGAGPGGARDGGRGRS